MRKGSKKDDYKIDPLKRELRDLYQEFYNKGYTSYKYLQLSDTDYRRLLELYNKINETSKSKKIFILNEKQYSLHYRQYCYMEKYRKHGKSWGKRIPKPQQRRPQQKRQLRRRRRHPRRRQLRRRLKRK